MRTATLAIFTLGLLIAAPVSAQIELSATAYGDSVKLSTPESSESRASLLGGLQAGFHMAPWSFSAEYASGDFLDLERNRSELAVGYSVSDSVALTAGLRLEDIRMTDSAYFFFFFFPVAVEDEKAAVGLTNGFLGVNYESDPKRKAGLLANARLYRGSADVSLHEGPNISDSSEGFRIEMGVRMGPPERSWILGAAYETFKLSDAGVDITSEPVVFLKYRCKLPLL